MTTKKTYVTPEALKIKFDYQDQVVAASSGACGSSWTNDPGDSCKDFEQVRNLNG